MEADFETAGLNDRRLAMLRFAVDVTRRPWEMTEEDVTALRNAGFTDVDALHITEVAGYYAYANRIADALGVPLEQWIAEH